MAPPDGADATDEEDAVPWADEGYQRTDRRTATTLWLGVLPQNLAIVEVFRRCQPQLAVGMSVFWQGVSAREVLAACVMSRVPRADWPRYIDGVQWMAQIAANVGNKPRGRKGQRKI